MFVVRVSLLFYVREYPVHRMCWTKGGGQKREAGMLGHVWGQRCYPGMGVLILTILLA